MPIHTRIQLRQRPLHPAADFVAPPIRPGAPPAVNMASVPIRATAQASHRPPPRPLPQGVVDHGYRYTLVQRVHCLVLLIEGYSVAEIGTKTGVSERSQRAIRKKAYDHRFRPEEDPRILESYAIDGVKSGRPKEILKGKEEALLAAVRSDRSGREKSSEVLAYEQDISQIFSLAYPQKQRTDQRRTYYQAWSNCGNAENSL
jgi:hypothetical protein